MTNVETSLAYAANPPATPQSAMRRWGPALGAIALGLTTILFVHGETVMAAVSTWSSTSTYKYAWAVIPALAYVLWHNRQHVAGLTPSGGALGVLAAAFCALAWIASDLSNIAVGRQFALVAAIGAVVLAAVGWRIFRALAPMLALLVFLVPSGSALLTPLKSLTVGFARAGAALLALPFSNDGFAIHIGAQRYVVIDDCAGLPYLLTGLFIGLTLALLIYRSWRKIASLTLLGGAAGILANGLRVIGIVLYDGLTGSELDLSQHRYFEWPALILGFAVLFVIYSRLRPESRAKPEPCHSKTGDKGIGRRFMPVLLAVALIAAGPLIWRDPAQALTGDAAGGLLPASLSGWTRQDDVAGDWQPRAHSSNVSNALATYTKDRQRIAIFVAQAASRREKVSGGAVEIVGDTAWMPSQQRQLSACGRERCHAGWRLTLLLRDSDRVRHIYAVYAIGSDTTASALEFRFRRAWASLTGAPARARLIAISTERAQGLEPAEIGALFEDLVKQ